jgi:hypothetical protein
MDYSIHVKHYMNWTFNVSITSTSKLPLDWEEQGNFTAYHVAHLTKAYSIPPSLVVNSDHINIHLVPIVGEHIWSNLEMTKCFMEIVMVPYHQAQIESLGLQTNDLVIRLQECT